LLCFLLYQCSNDAPRISKALLAQITNSPDR
jgi:hypothetical protein